MAEIVGQSGTEFPAVTVIILASDNGVGVTIESVLAQDYTNFDCIVVEDEAIVSFARTIALFRTEQLDRLSFLPREKGSDCDSLNDALRQATGSYVTIVRSGDSFSTNWLTVCVAFMEANPEMIVGYSDWVLADRQGNVVQDDPAPDYDFYRMVLDPNCMPGPGALIRRSVVSIPRLRNRSFRVANGYETWLLLGLQGDFIHIPATTALRRNDTGQLRERVAEYRHASDALFNQAGLPGPVHRWRRSSRVHVAFVCAVTVAPERPWTAMRLLLLAFLFGPRSTSQRFLYILAKYSEKLARFGIPAPVCGWIGHLAERGISARRKSAY